MAYLVVVQVSNGDWDAHVVSHPSQRYHGDVDVLGRVVPDFCFVEAWDGVRKDDAVRLANTMNGIPRSRRREVVLEHARGLNLSARGGTIKEP